MSIINELRLERELKARSDALNRALLEHDEELDELREDVEFYKRTTRNLVALIILGVLIGGYAVYLKTTPLPTCDISGEQS